jgi:hypothetical protein
LPGQDDSSRRRVSFLKPFSVFRFCVLRNVRHTSHLAGRYCRRVALLPPRLPLSQYFFEWSRTSRNESGRASRYPCQKARKIFTFHFRMNARTGFVGEADTTCRRSFADRRPPGMEFIPEPPSVPQPHHSNNPIASRVSFLTRPTETSGPPASSRSSEIGVSGPYQDESVSSAPSRPAEVASRASSCIFFPYSSQSNLSHSSSEYIFADA